MIHFFYIFQYFIFNIDNIENNTNINCFNNIENTLLTINEKEKQLGFLDKLDNIVHIK